MIFSFSKKKRDEAGNSIKRLFIIVCYLHNRYLLFRYVAITDAFSNRAAGKAMLVTKALVCSRGVLLMQHGEERHLTRSK